MDKQGYINDLFERWGPYNKGHYKQLVETAINYAYNQIAGELIDAGDDIMLSTKKYNNVTVSLDGTTSIGYAEYPVDIVYAGATKVINTVKGTGYRFYPTTERMVRLMEGTYMDGLNVKIGYIPKRERVEFYNIKDSMGALVISSVSMELAVQFKSFSDSDTVLMPRGRDYEVMQLALDFLKQQPIIDLKND